jgi:serine/threonine-protein phosphatase 6 regulatory ankyrin repeat subunit B
MKKSTLNLSIVFVGYLILLMINGPAAAGAQEDELLSNSAFHLDLKGIDIALRRGANPNAVNPQTGRSILYMASAGIGLAKAERREAGDLKGVKSAEADGILVLRLLFKKGAKLSERDDDILFGAIADGHIQVLNLLLENGADPHKRVSGYLPTEVAVKYGQNEIYRALLSRNASPVSKEDNLQLRLITAAGDRNRATVSALIKNGAKLNVPDTCGNTALVSALGSALLTEAHVTYIEWLLSQGADANLPSKNRCLDQTQTYPIHELFSLSFDLGNDAMEDRQVAVMVKLLRGGADINATDTFGNTVLHQIARSKKYHPLLAEWLVVQGANVNARDKSGKTPIEVASSKEMVNALRNKSSGNK